MHAHILASPSNAEELRKNLTELSAFRHWQRRPSIDVGSVPQIMKENLEVNKLVPRAHR